MMDTLCFHHNDADGRASAAIVRRALGDHVLCYEMDYNHVVVPWNAVEVAGRVVVVDFSLPREQMLRLADGRELIWIDHHKSALEELADVADRWPGLRRLDEAACVLTWRYFFPNQPVPRAVVLIGDRDIWRWAEPDTGAFNEALFHRNTHVDNTELWQRLLDDDPALLEELIREGRRLREIRLNQTRRLVERFGFEVQFEGYRTLAINVRGNGDLGEHIRSLGYDIAYCYMDQMENGKLLTSVTLYAETVDVSAIARRFGGGGHAGAAGFSFPRGASPFPPGADVRWPS